MGEGVIAFCVIVCVVAAGLAWWAVEICRSTLELAMEVLDEIHAPEPVITEEESRG